MPSGGSFTFIHNICHDVEFFLQPNIIKVKMQYGLHINIFFVSILSNKIYSCHFFYRFWSDNKSLIGESHLLYSLNNYIKQMILLYLNKNKDKYTTQLNNNLGHSPNREEELLSLVPVTPPDRSDSDCPNILLKYINILQLSFLWTWNDH